MKKHVRKLIKSSTHSYAIIIPKEIIKKYGWREKQRLVVADEGRGKISIKDYRA